MGTCKRVEKFAGFNHWIFQVDATNECSKVRMDPVYSAKLWIDEDSC